MVVVDGGLVSLEVGGSDGGVDGMVRLDGVGGVDGVV